MASSVEEVAYEFGALLSIALLGSLLTGLYTVFVQLPPGVDAAAARSISAALDIVAGSGGALPDHLAHLGQHLSPTLAEPGLAGSLPAEDAAARQEAASLLVAAQTALWCSAAQRRWCSAPLPAKSLISNIVSGTYQHL